jgi:leader peptidase (prepilin peptidase)/N-methyltransferase
MSTPLTLLGGAVLGAAAGMALVPLTRRQLAASVARSSAATSEETREVAVAVGAPAVSTTQRVVLALASGLLPAYVLYKTGWSLVALPPLLLLVGLVQLAYCDLTRRLLPKTLVWALTAAVMVSGVVVAGVMHEWHRLAIALIGGLAFYTLLFVMNLINPRWIAFGDVRLSLVVGFGLAWVSATALLEGFLVANVLGAVVGLFLIAVRRADRDHAVPFGLYLALGTAVVLLAWA